ncbi:hypothetical protein CAOG_03695 [Capsaspora owczarzaki ATCC 30864]|uniref:hypothetical protein n=1 Tax=Capsaspora owczarzaki (strain ATCC 30864) TaxID=595528 RepID=UPI0001FEF47A|nr:hypothetical protein CAOG_03695 [Capsaspora owczarzaki ATCC 30864]|eukprot:XP_004363423.1 hypothetical protein CAOG_03695 [Capsaspora owczarzaki ATCC 30864]
MVLLPETPPPVSPPPPLPSEGSSEEREQQQQQQLPATTTPPEPAPGPAPVPSAAAPSAPTEHHDVPHHRTASPENAEMQQQERVDASTNHPLAPNAESASSRLSEPPLSHEAFPPSQANEMFTASFEAFLGPSWKLKSSDSLRLRCGDLQALGMHSDVVLHHLSTTEKGVSHFVTHIVIPRARLLQYLKTTGNVITYKYFVQRQDNKFTWEFLYRSPKLSDRLLLLDNAVVESGSFIRFDGPLVPMTDWYSWNQEMDADSVAPAVTLAVNSMLWARLTTDSLPDLISRAEDICTGFSEHQVRLHYENGSGIEKYHVSHNRICDAVSNALLDYCKATILNRRKPNSSDASASSFGKRFLSLFSSTQATDSNTIPDLVEAILIAAVLRQCRFSGLAADDLSYILNALEIKNRDDLLNFRSVFGSSARLPGKHGLKSVIQAVTALCNVGLDAGNPDWLVAVPLLNFLAGMQHSTPVDGLGDLRVDGFNARHLKKELSSTSALAIRFKSNWVRVYTSAQPFDRNIGVTLLMFTPLWLWHDDAIQSRISILECLHVLIRVVEHSAVTHDRIEDLEMYMTYLANRLSSGPITFEHSAAAQLLVHNILAAPITHPDVHLRVVLGSINLQAEMIKARFKLLRDMGSGPVGRSGEGLQLVTSPASALSVEQELYETQRILTMSVEAFFRWLQEASQMLVHSGPSYASAAAAGARAAPSDKNVDPRSNLLNVLAWWNEIFDADAAESACKLVFDQPLYHAAVATGPNVADTNSGPSSTQPFMGEHAPTSRPQWYTTAHDSFVRWLSTRFASSPDNDQRCIQMFAEISISNNAHVRMHPSMQLAIQEWCRAAVTRNQPTASADQRAAAAAWANQYKLVTLLQSHVAEFKSLPPSAILIFRLDVLDLLSKILESFGTNIDQLNSRSALNLVLDWPCWQVYFELARLCPSQDPVVPTLSPASWKIVDSAIQILSQASLMLETCTIPYAEYRLIADKQAQFTELLAKGYTCGFHQFSSNPAPSVKAWLAHCDSIVEQHTRRRGLHETFARVCELFETEDIVLDSAWLKGLLRLQVGTSTIERLSTQFVAVSHEQSLQRSTLTVLHIVTWLLARPTDPVTISFRQSLKSAARSWLELAQRENSVAAQFKRAVALAAASSSESAASSSAASQASSSSSSAGPSASTPDSASAHDPKKVSTDVVERLLLDVVHEWAEYAEKVRDATVTFAELDAKMEGEEQLEFLWKCFSPDLLRFLRTPDSQKPERRWVPSDRLPDGLPLVDSGRLSSRQRQIHQYRALRSVRQAAKAVNTLCNTLELQDLVRDDPSCALLRDLCDDADNVAKRQLGFMTDSVQASAGELASLDDGDIACIKVIATVAGRPSGLISFLRDPNLQGQHNFESFISVCNSMVEHRDEVDAISWLHAAQTVLAPFLELCSKYGQAMRVVDGSFWKDLAAALRQMKQTVRTTADVAQKVESAADKLTWIRNLKDSTLNDVTVTSISQVHTIAKAGLCIVGSKPPAAADSGDGSAIDGSGPARKSHVLPFDLDAVGDSDDPEECVWVRLDGEHAHRSNKGFFSHHALRDLQSKLMLVSSSDEKSEAIKKDVDKFVEVMHLLSRIARFVTQLRLAGHLSYRTFEWTARYSELADNPHLLTEQARHLENALRDWQKSMEDLRQTNPALNVFTTRQLVLLHDLLAAHGEHRPPALPYELYNLLRAVRSDLTAKQMGRLVQDSDAVVLFAKTVRDQLLWQQQQESQVGRQRPARRSRKVQSRVPSRRQREKSAAAASVQSATRSSSAPSANTQILELTQMGFDHGKIVWALNELGEHRTTNDLVNWIIERLDHDLPAQFASAAAEAAAPAQSFAAPFDQYDVDDGDANVDDDSNADDDDDDDDDSSVDDDASDDSDDHLDGAGCSWESWWTSEPAKPEYSVRAEVSKDGVERVRVTRAASDNAEDPESGEPDEMADLQRAIQLSQAAVSEHELIQQAVKISLGEQHPGTGDGKPRTGNAEFASGVNFIQVLARLLTRIQDHTASEKPTSLVRPRRTFPKSGLFHLGRPNLLVCPPKDMYYNLLSLYLRDPTQETDSGAAAEEAALPTADEVLVCSASTTAEQALNLIRRAEEAGKGAKSGEQPLYCLAFADQLPFAVQDEVVHKLRLIDAPTRTADRSPTGFQLVILVANGSSYVAGALARYRVAGFTCSSPAHLQQSLSVSIQQARISSRLESDGIPNVIVVTAERSGMGKSLIAGRLGERVQSACKHRASEKVLSLRGAFTNDDIVNGLVPDHKPHASTPRVYRLDLVGRVTEATRLSSTVASQAGPAAAAAKPGSSSSAGSAQGAASAPPPSTSPSGRQMVSAIGDDISMHLFNLLILGCIQGSDGRLRHRLPQDVFIVEADLAALLIGATKQVESDAIPDTNQSNSQNHNNQNSNHNHGSSFEYQPSVLGLLPCLRGTSPFDTCRFMQGFIELHASLKTAGESADSVTARMLKQLRHAHRQLAYAELVNVHEKLQLELVTMALSDLVRCEMQFQRVVDYLSKLGKSAAFSHRERLLNVKIPLELWDTTRVDGLAAAGQFVTSVVTAFTDGAAALKALLKDCGISNPSWTLISCFSMVLGVCLVEAQSSPYCSPALADDLPGFREFVFKLLVLVARDFATPSLSFVQQFSHLASSSQDGSRPASGSSAPGPLASGLELADFQVRHAWEDSSHPYVFFNGGGSGTVTFFGFQVDENRDVIAPPGLLVGDRARPLGLDKLSPELVQSLQRNGVDLRPAYNQWPREYQIRILRLVMGVAHLADGRDPDPSYVLNVDNMKKLIAVHLRFLSRTAVVLLGETGCGKTTLIKFMCDLKGSDLVLLKVHGGISEADIIAAVERAEAIAEYRCSRGDERDTVLFLDEVNTCNHLGLIKELLCDGRIAGRSINSNLRLRIVAACNPYRRHTDERLRQLQQTGLGYHVASDRVVEKLGHVPLRQLVYAVHPLPESLATFVWDFGKLDAIAEADTIHQMVATRLIPLLVGSMPNDNEEVQNAARLFAKFIIAPALVASQVYMREQTDECGFVSLRDVDRAIEIASWFINRTWLFTEFADQVEMAPNHSFASGFGRKRAPPSSASTSLPDRVKHWTRCLILALAIGYHARLSERERRQKYREHVSQALQSGGRKAVQSARVAAAFSIEQHTSAVTEASFLGEVRRMQCAFLSQMPLGARIARNDALAENVLMMIVCAEQRIPLFLVGKPGSSKSLAKAVVADAMHGAASQSPLFQRLKALKLFSYQCSPLSTSEGIAGTFERAIRFQEGRGSDQCVSLVCLDEIGLAEDSPKLPLKILHSLLEERQASFVGISNWALDPAKLNRGLFVSRTEMTVSELEETARGICSTSGVSGAVDYPQLAQVLPFLAEAYYELYEKQQKGAFPSLRPDYFGLRDFYYLIKMLLKQLREQDQDNLKWADIERAVRRNFGGSDEHEMHQFVEIFRRNIQAQLDHLAVLHQDVYSSGSRAAEAQPDDLDFNESSDNNVLSLVQANLASTRAEQRRGGGMMTLGDSRYLLLLTDNYSAFDILFSNGILNENETVVIFGSPFPNDDSQIQIYRNINRIKMCAETGRTVVLLNLESLYESLYDLLNQFYTVFHNYQYVDLGLGTNRVKCRVDPGFRLVVVAERQKVLQMFPIPLINRLEKHILMLSVVFSSEKQHLQTVVSELAQWVKDFCSGRMPAQVGNAGAGPAPPWQLAASDAFVGFCDDLIPSLVIRVARHLNADCLLFKPRSGFELEGLSTELLEQCKLAMLGLATPDAVIRLNHSNLRAEADKWRETYFTQQPHSSLADAIHAITQKPSSALPSVISTHSKSENLEAVVQTLQGVETTWLDLRQHDSELGFVQAIHRFYRAALRTLADYCEDQQSLKAGIAMSLGQNCDSTSDTSSLDPAPPCLLLVQCDASVASPNLLPCVRHILHRERTAFLAETDVQQVVGKLPDHRRQMQNAYIVLLVHAPRGAANHSFSASFTSVQFAFHVDSLLPPSAENLDEVSLLYGRVHSIHDLFADATGSQPDAVLRDHSESVHDLLDPVTLIRHAIHPALAKLELKQFRKHVEEAALSDPHTTLTQFVGFRIRLLLELTSTDEPFISALQSRFLLLMRDRHQRSSSDVSAQAQQQVRSSAWLSSIAMQFNLLHECGTFRAALWRTLLDRAETMLASLLALVDSYGNLSLLAGYVPEVNADDALNARAADRLKKSVLNPREQIGRASLHPARHLDAMRGVIRRVWCGLFALDRVTSLSSVADHLERSEGFRPLAVFALSDNRIFINRFPFSWKVFEFLNSLYKLAQARSVGTAVEVQKSVCDIMLSATAARDGAIVADVFDHCHPGQDPAVLASLVKLYQLDALELALHGSSLAVHKNSRLYDAIAQLLLGWTSSCLPGSDRVLPALVRAQVAISQTISVLSAWSAVLFAIPAESDALAIVATLQGFLDGAAGGEDLEPSDIASSDLRQRMQALLCAEAVQLLVGRIKNKEFKTASVQVQREWASLTLSLLPRIESLLVNEPSVQAQTDKTCQWISSLTAVAHFIVQVVVRVPSADEGGLGTDVASSLFATLEDADVRSSSTLGKVISFINSLLQGLTEQFEICAICQAEAGEVYLPCACKRVYCRQDLEEHLHRRPQECPLRHDLRPFVGEKILALSPERIAALNQTANIYRRTVQMFEVQLLLESISSSGLAESQLAPPRGFSPASLAVLVKFVLELNDEADAVRPRPGQRSMLLGVVLRRLIAELNWREEAELTVPSALADVFVKTLSLRSRFGTQNKILLPVQQDSICSLHGTVHDLPINEDLVDAGASYRGPLAVSIVESLEQAIVQHVTDSTPPASVQRLAMISKCLSTAAAGLPEASEWFGALACWPAAPVHTAKVTFSGLWLLGFVRASLALCADELFAISLRRFAWGEWLQPHLDLVLKHLARLCLCTPHSPTADGLPLRALFFKHLMATHGVPAVDAIFEHNGLKDGLAELLPELTAESRLLRAPVHLPGGLNASYVYGESHVNALVVSCETGALAPWTATFDLESKSFAQFVSSSLAIHFVATHLHLRALSQSSVIVPGDYSIPIPIQQELVREAADKLLEYVPQVALSDRASPNSEAVTVMTDSARVLRTLILAMSNSDRSNVSNFASVDDSGSFSSVFALHALQPSIRSLAFAVAIHASVGALSARSWLLSPLVTYGTSPSKLSHSFMPGMGALHPSVRGQVDLDASPRDAAVSRFELAVPHLVERRDRLSASEREVHRRKHSLDPPNVRQEEAALLQAGFDLLLIEGHIPLLQPVDLLVIRTIMHGLLTTVSCLDPSWADALGRVVEERPLARGDPIAGFFEAHLERDLQSLAQLLDTSVDDAAVLIHTVVEGFGKHIDASDETRIFHTYNALTSRRSPNSGSRTFDSVAAAMQQSPFSMLESCERRTAWEVCFAATYIAPALKELRCKKNLLTVSIPERHLHNHAGVYELANVSADNVPWSSAHYSPLRLRAGRTASRASLALASRVHVDRGVSDFNVSLSYLDLPSNAAAIVLMRYSQLFALTAKLPALIALQHTVATSFDKVLYADHLTQQEDPRQQRPRSALESRLAAGQLETAMQQLDELQATWARLKTLLQSHWPVSVPASLQKRDVSQLLDLLPLAPARAWQLFSEQSHWATVDDQAQPWSVLPFVILTLAEVHNIGARLLHRAAGNDADSPQSVLLTELKPIDLLAHGRIDQAIDLSLQSGIHESLQIGRGSELGVDMAELQSNLFFLLVADRPVIALPTVPSQQQPQQRAAPGASAAAGRQIATCPWVFSFCGSSDVFDGDSAVLAEQVPQASLRVADIEAVVTECHHDLVDVSNLLRVLEMAAGFLQVTGGSPTERLVNYLRNTCLLQENNVQSASPAAASSSAASQSFPSPAQRSMAGARVSARIASVFESRVICLQHIQALSSGLALWRAARLSSTDCQPFAANSMLGSVVADTLVKALKDISPNSCWTLQLALFELLRKRIRRAPVGPQLQYVTPLIEQLRLSMRYSDEEWEEFAALLPQSIRVHHLPHVFKLAISVSAFSAAS